MLTNEWVSVYISGGILKGFKYLPEPCLIPVVLLVDILVVTLIL
jgi:hypothetical protein